jgi:hypothetical protein
VEILPGTVIGYDLEEDRKRFTVSDKGVVIIPKGRIICPHIDRPRWRSSMGEPKPRNTTPPRLDKKKGQT